MKFSICLENWRDYTSVCVPCFWGCPIVVILKFFHPVNVICCTYETRMHNPIKNESKRNFCLICRSYFFDNQEVQKLSIDQWSSKEINFLKSQSSENLELEREMKRDTNVLMLYIITKAKFVVTQVYDGRSNNLVSE